MFYGNLNAGMTGKSTKPDNSNFLTNLGNASLVFLLKALALLPFKCIYVLSDILFFLNKYFIKYRYKVTEDNLISAFPGKTDEEIAVLRNKFYRHFFDFSLEAIKLYNVSEREISKRIIFKGVDLINRSAEHSSGAIILAFHYNNWEWSSFAQKQINDPVLMVYNPPRDNKPMENFLKQSRGKWGGKVIRTGWAARTVLRHKQKGEPAVLWLAADQTALASSPFWIRFLNREAAFFAGPLVLGPRTNFPILFQHCKKTGRGRYEVEFSVLVEEPAGRKPEEILKAYVQKMEEVIKSHPEYYLWSHNRWKHGRPETTPLIRYQALLLW